MPKIRIFNLIYPGRHIFYTSISNGEKNQHQSAEWEICWPQQLFFRIFNRKLETFVEKRGFCADWAWVNLISVSMWYVATVTSLSRIFLWECIIWKRIYSLPLCFLSWTLSISSNSTMIQLHEFDVSKGSIYNQSFVVQEFKSSKPIFNEKQSIFLVHILISVCCTHRALIW